MIRWIRSWFTPDVVFDIRSDSCAIYPTRGSKESAGLDLYANASIEIAPGATTIISTGLKASFNPGWAAFIWDRSGMGAKGLHRFAGLIDSDYRGLWGVVIHNTTDSPLEINYGDRIAQVVFQRVWTGKPKVGTVKDDTKRGVQGFGSTGK
jgi:dUTP pyrophosphatase